MFTKPARRAAAVVLILIAGCSLEHGAPEGEASVPGPFRGTVRITLTREWPRPKVEARVTDPSVVRELLAAIQLVPKQPCKCEHGDTAVFEKPGSAVSVSLCSHCFDFSGQHYRMPQEFYQLFQREINKAVGTPGHPTK